VDTGSEGVPVWVQKWQDAAPTRLLVEALVAGGQRVRARADDAAALAVGLRGPVLRVMPHQDYDACGYEGTHAVYTVTWAIPHLCQVPQPPVLPARGVEGLRPVCDVCADAARHDLGLLPEERTPVGPHVAWWDLTAPQTLRARRLAPEVLAARAGEVPLPDPADVYDADRLRLMGGAEQAAEIIALQRRLAIAADSTAGVYDWDDLAGRLAGLAARERPPRLDPEQRVALAGVRRLRALTEIDNATESLKGLMANTRSSGPSRLEKLSGVSRQTITAWLGKLPTDTDTDTDTDGTESEGGVAAGTEAGA